MMKLNVKKIIFGIVYLGALLVLFLCRAPLSLQTNLNSLIEINNADWPVNKLTIKFLLNLQIIVFDI